MKLHISHRSVYHYPERVRHSTQCLRLTPQSSRRQRVLSWQLGLPARASSGRDPYGNCQHVLTLDYPHQDITVLATGVVEVDEALADDVDDELAPLVFLRQTTRTAPSAARLALAQRHAEAVRQHGRHGALSLAQALAEQSGAAKDSVGASHALLGCLRALAQPARYVSGYLSLADGGEVAHHNWVELWRDGVWASVDPMSLAPAGGGHVKLAVGMDELDACPIRGLRRPSMEDMLRQAQHSAQQ
ncbi:transglutaminase N-terminal domain-containing protein [Rivihabitans pingtungensis]|uniref:transglutaminase N-terminal domain-containing protein n=1 Tax=Rivihabitans pingtungensis TaxID=1054498 RepID=UPI00235721A9|nr:transglutaminase N-terminal domain-containing protein [Rivihabitans pingtungensis]MCK6437608.1 transglutaminase family protein [Rivihabitans pingtungensis]